MSLYPKQSLCPPGIFQGGIVWSPRPTTCVPQVLVFVPFSLCDQQSKARPQRELGSSAVLMQMDPVKCECIFNFVYFYLFPWSPPLFKNNLLEFLSFSESYVTYSLCPAENNYSFIYNIYSTYFSYWFVLFFPLIK